MNPKNQTANPEQESYLTTRETAVKLGLSLRTIQLWVESGVLTAWKTAGGHRRIASSSVEELLRQREDSLKKRPSGNPFTLVVVEDNQQMLELYEQQIKQWDMSIHLVTASNGFEGLLQIGQWEPDLIITDLDMPGMNGFQMIEALCEKPELGNTQIAVVTGLRPEEIKAKGELHKDIMVYLKPVDFNQLEKLVKNQLDKQSATKHAH
jgi:excisionase family DNA binding protein